MEAKPSEEITERSKVRLIHCHVGNTAEEAQSLSFLRKIVAPIYVLFRRVNIDIALPLGKLCSYENFWWKFFTIVSGAFGKRLKSPFFGHGLTSKKLDNLISTAGCFPTFRQLSFT